MALADVIEPGVQATRARVGDRAVRLVLSPLDAEPATWRRELIRSLRALVDADAAACLFWHGERVEHSVEALEPGVVTEYLEQFASIDLGMRRRDALGLGLWSRHLLWPRDTLLRSPYYHEFALPRRLLDTVGLSIDFDEIAAHLRVVLIYRHRPLGGDASEERLMRLQPFLPALRSGLRIQLGFHQWVRHTTSLLDKVGERLMLFSLQGRELHRNATMRRTLDADQCGERLYAAIRAAACAMATCARGDRPLPRGEPGHVGPPRQEIEGSTGRYRVRACLIGPEVVGPDSLVLVTMERTTPEPPSATLLQARYDLTAREIDVAVMLLRRMTNREIAAALGISPHTARHHTEKVLGKVRVNSRRALRRALADES